MLEKQITKEVCKFIKLRYPNVIFTVDTSGIRLTIGQATQMKSLRSGRGIPDLLIFEPRGNYKGLFIEIKKDSPYKKNGELKKDKHLEEQSEMLCRLNRKGYVAFFCAGVDECLIAIKDYMEL